MLMVHNRELVWRHELRRGKIGETILSIFMNHKYNRMRKIKKNGEERERERERERESIVLLLIWNIYPWATTSDGFNF